MECYCSTPGKRYWKISLVVMVITCESIEFITSLRGYRENLSQGWAKFHHFKIVSKSNRPFYDFKLLRKTLRNNKKNNIKKSEMGLELRTKIKKIMSSKFLLYKNLHNFFLKHSRHLACQDVVDFILKSERKHQQEPPVLMLDLNSN